LINRSDKEVVESFFAGAAFGLALTGETFFGGALLIIGFGTLFLLTTGFGLANAFLLGAGVGFAPFFEAVIIN
jgi:hypothetical protein